MDTLLIDQNGDFQRPAQASATSGAMDYALNMVESLGEAGLTAVPLKPTLPMLTAGARAGSVSIETAWKIYQAMISEEA